MVFFYGRTGPSRTANDQAKIRALLDSARHSRSCFGGFGQHMLVAEGAIEVASNWNFKPCGPRGARNMSRKPAPLTTAREVETIYSGQLISTNQTEQYTTKF